MLQKNNIADQNSHYSERLPVKFDHNSIQRVANQPGEWQKLLVKEHHLHKPQCHWLHGLD